MGKAWRNLTENWGREGKDASQYFLLLRDAKPLRTTGEVSEGSTATNHSTCSFS